MSSRSSNTGRILVLEPDKKLAAEIADAAKQAAPRAHVQTAHSLEEAQHLVLDERPDLFVLDIDASADLSQDFLYDLRTSHPNARAIILTEAHGGEIREQAAGLGAIHFLEKPFPHADFVDLVKALLQPPNKSASEKFQGTLSELHIADIVQLKCMSRANSAVEFTAADGKKARVYFENGQVRHASAPGKEGVAAFNEIVNWKGGTISEISGAPAAPHTITTDWQVLLMEAVRGIDESRGKTPRKRKRSRSAGRKVLVIDDSLMMLSFVSEMLSEAHFQAQTAATAEEGLRVAAEEPPDLILLDFLLPDMKGDEVSRRLAENAATAQVPIVYMSGFGADLQRESLTKSNVVGFLNKPFTSEVLIKTVEKHMPNQEGEPEPSTEESSAETAPEPMPESAPSDWPTPAMQSENAEPPLFEPAAEPFVPQPQWQSSDFAAPASGAYFSGDTSFFSLNWALRTIAQQKLTGALRLFWSKEPVDLLTQNGEIVLVTTRDPELYCSEAPITLANVDPGRVEEARARQRQDGCPMFITLSREEAILRDPALQLVQHYGQKLFAQLWAEPRVRFMFEQNSALPDYAQDVPAEDDIDQWSLTTLRFIQYHELGDRANFDINCIPAYTRDGVERVQRLRLTVAEAQFASQFNGTRSVGQIAKNLRLDLKFARLSLFRFLALEIVDCWPPGVAAGTKRRGIFSRIGQSIGLGE